VQETRTMPGEDVLNRRQGKLLYNNVFQGGFLEEPHQLRHCPTAEHRNPTAARRSATHRLGILEGCETPAQG
jgi:hypothetical protein